MITIRDLTDKMFPAPAGMTPAWFAQGLLSLHVPRACGDDPEGNPFPFIAAICSPRLRG